MTRLFEAKPFLIAEVGSNWRTLDQCVQSIGVAQYCGADAVKLQLFDGPSMYGLLGDALEFELPHDWLPILKKEADRVGIEFMCTAFSPKLLAVVDPFVEVHKIASSDSSWPQMLEAVKATGKPTLVSYGASTEVEIDESERVMSHQSDKYISMYCVAAYPADFVDFEVMDHFEGFSDHTLGYTAAVEAARRGMIVIEKHFTAFPDLDTPDRPHSLNPVQFKSMVDVIRGGSVDQEQDMRLRHKRRLITTQKVAVGEVLKYGVNYGAYRSRENDVYGLSPMDWQLIEGKSATLELNQGQPIAAQDAQ